MGGLNAYMMSLTTAETIAVWKMLGNWNMRSDAGANTYGHLIRVAHGHNDGLDAAVGTPGSIVGNTPSWQNVQLGLTTSADGFTVDENVPCCAGITLLKVMLEGRANTRVANAVGTGTITRQLTGPAFRRRLYIMAAGIRCCADVIFDCTNSSRLAEEYSSGVSSTGNAALDEILDMNMLLGDRVAFSPDTLLQTVVSEAAYYGLLSPGSIAEGYVYNMAVIERAYPDQRCVRCAFHPAIAKLFLGDECGRSGGHYKFSAAWATSLQSSLAELWSTHDVEGMRTSEAVAVLQSMAATKGAPMFFGQWVEASNAEMGRREDGMVQFMPNFYCCPSDNFIDLSIMTPTLWWYRPVYPGRMRVISTGLQLKAGYCIQNGYRVESDPNAATNALSALHGSNGIIYNGPGRGQGRQRWLMRSNGVAAPALLPNAPNGHGRDVAVTWFNNMLGSINRVAQVLECKNGVSLYLGAARRLMAAEAAINADTLGVRQRGDVRGYIHMPRGLRHRGGGVLAPVVGHVTVTDF
jgi:hypothetical protein